MQVADFTIYVHLTNGTWVKVQDQAQVGISATHYVADFSGDAHIPIRKQPLPDGSVSLDALEHLFDADAIWQKNQTCGLEPT